MSITNFYYFNNNILYKKPKCANNQIDDDLRIRAIADSHMEIKETCDELPLSAGDALISLFPGEEERLLMMGNETVEQFRARVECEPMDIEVAFSYGSYIITLPEYSFPSGERIAELVSLTSKELPPRIKECALAYRQLISGTTEDIGIGNVNKLLKRVIKIIGFVKGYIIQSTSDRKLSVAPKIKYSEKDFYRLIITAISVSFAMAGDENVEMSCRIGNRIASFRAVFSHSIPNDIKELLISGKYDSSPFNGLHGDIFMMLSYIRHICHVYGYFLTLESSGPNSMSLSITLPLAKKGSGALAIKEYADKKWIKALIESMLP